MVHKSGKQRFRESPCTRYQRNAEILHWNSIWYSCVTALLAICLF